MEKQSFRELKRLAREFLDGRYLTPILAMAAAYLLPTALLAPFSTSAVTSWNVQLVSYIVAAGIISLLAKLLNAGIIRIHLRMAKKQPVSFKDLFWAFQNKPDRFLLCALIMAAIFLIPTLPACIFLYQLAWKKTAAAYLSIGATAILLSIALLYLAFSFRMAFPLYIENEEMGVWEGIRLSIRYMRGNKLRCFLLQLSFIGWQLLGISSLGVGMLWVLPYMSQTQANFYLDLMQKLTSETGSSV